MHYELCICICIKLSLPLALGGDAGLRSSHMKFASKLCPYSCGSRWIITTKLKSICHKLHTIILHGNAINIMKPLQNRWWKHQYPSHSTVLITNLNPCISDNPQVPSAIKGYCLDDQLRVVVAVEPIERLSVGLVSIAV